LEAAVGKEAPGLDGVEDAANALLVAVHEGDHGGEDGADVPAGAPGLLVIVREGGADGLGDLEAAVVGEEADLGRREGVVFGELEHAVVETPLELFFEIVEAEVEAEVVVPLHQHARDGLLLDRLHLLVYSDIGNLLAHLSLYLLFLLNY
jgi:hypothetical protein